MFSFGKETSFEKGGKETTRLQRKEKAAVEAEDEACYGWEHAKANTEA